MSEDRTELTLDSLTPLHGAVAFLRAGACGADGETMAIRRHGAAFMAAEVLQESEIAAPKPRPDRVARRLELAQ